MAKKKKTSEPDDSTIFRGVVVRIYPNAEQAETLSAWAETCRRIYNMVLGYWRDLGRSQSKRKLSAFSLGEELRECRKLNEFYANVPSAVVEMVAARAWNSIERFYEGKAKYPHFKGKDDGYTLEFRQSVSVKKGVVFLSMPLKDGKRQGQMAVPFHDKGVMSEGGYLNGIKRIAVWRRGEKKWYASITLEIKDFVSDAPPPKCERVAIDAGINSFAVLSDGEDIKAPRPYQAAEKRLQRLQRKFSRQTRITNPDCYDENGRQIKGKRMKLSKRALRTKERINAAHERVVNIRESFLHQTANRLVSTFGVLEIEDLKIKKMMRKKKGANEEGVATPEAVQGKRKQKYFSKGFADAGWGKFRQFIEYKSKWHGRSVVAVKPEYTTRTCNGCGYVSPEKIETFAWRCPECHTVHKRKYNAARNIADKASSLESRA